MQETLESIGKRFGKKVVSNSSDIPFGNISIDSRTIKEGDIFLCLEGPNFDGHLFIEESKKKGAVGFILEKEDFSIKPYILVKNSSIFLNELSTYKRNKFKGKVIGLTGSNGKTTTKEMIYSLLNQKGSCSKTLGNQNNHIGVPLTLIHLNDDYDFSVVEMGTNSAGEINSLSSIVRPDVALITNIGESHLEKLETVEKVAEEKSFILKNSSKDSVAILPKDSDHFEYLRDACLTNTIVTFGYHKDSDFQLDKVEIDVNKKQVSFNINHSMETDSFVLDTLATHNCLNMCAALSVCHSIGFSIDEVRGGVKNLSYPRRRMELKSTKAGALLIDDSYNSNPDSMKKSIDLLSNYKDKRKFLIAGEMAELGDLESFYHEDICKYAAKKLDEFLCIGKLWKEGINHLEGEARIFNSKDELLEYLNIRLDKDSIILIKGSRSTKMDYIVDKITK